MIAAAILEHIIAPYLRISAAALVGDLRLLNKCVYKRPHGKVTYMYIGTRDDMPPMHVLYRNGVIQNWLEVMHIINPRTMNVSDSLNHEARYYSINGRLPNRLYHDVEHTFMASPETQQIFINGMFEIVYCATYTAIGRYTGYHTKTTKVIVSEDDSNVYAVWLELNQFAEYIKMLAKPDYYAVSRGPLSFKCEPGRFIVSTEYTLM